MMKNVVINGVKQYTIKEWLLKLKYFGLIGESAFRDIIDCDNKKFLNLISASERFNLPIAKFITLDGQSCNENLIKENTSKLNTQLCNVRMISNAHSALPNLRLHGLSEKNIVAYILNTDHLELYSIVISEHHKPYFSGSILSSNDSVIIELVKGPHLHLTQAGKAKIYNGIWSNYKMIYNTKSVFIRELLWKSLKNIITNRSNLISPLNRPVFAVGYYEFIYTANLKFYLTDYTENRFFVNNRAVELFV